MDLDGLSVKTRERLRGLFKLTEIKKLALLAVCVGAICGFSAFVFISTMNALYNVFFSNYHGATGWFSWNNLWVILIPALGGLAIGPVVYYLAPETKGHGVPEVMLAVAKSGGRIRFRVGLTKAIASVICIGTGGSAGREGPIVQIGSSIGSAFGQWFRVPPGLLRMLVACGAAAGISATFNAPIAGVLFSLEVILREFAGRAFSIVVLSSVTASVVSRTLLGEAAFFHAPTYRLDNPWELLFYVCLGAIAALVGRLFVVSLYRFEDFFDKVRVPGFLKPAVGGLLLGLVGYYLPQVFATGHATIEAAMSASLPMKLLLVLVLAKILATSLTLGSGGSGGVFAPSLFMGAALGGGWGLLLNRFFPSIAVHPGAYALVGMSAVFAGATLAPITAVIVIFEMTHDYGIILPLMSAVVVSSLVAYSLSPDSIYTVKLKRRKIELDRRPDWAVLGSMPVSQIMSRRVETMPVGMPLAELVERLQASLHTGFPVVDAEGWLAGMLTYREMRLAIVKSEGLGSIIAVKDLMREDPPSAFPDDSVSIALQTMNKSEIDRLPVVDRSDPRRIIGIVTYHDIVNAAPLLRPQE
jgi:CIC family chloride channel protein